MASAEPAAKAGWEVKTFEDCIEKVKLTTKIPRKQFQSDGKFPIVSQEEDFINGRWDNESDIFKVERPVTIFGDHTQILKYVDFDFVLGADGVKILCPKDFLSPKFFFYFLHANPLKSLGYARHYRQLKTLEVNYPNSIPEQERIVGILDEAFEGIAAATAQAEKNLHNARELFQSVLQSTFSQKGDDWEETTLETDIKFIDYRGRTPKKTDSGLRLITAKNVRMGFLQREPEEFVAPESYDSWMTRGIPQIEDVLFTTEAPLGLVCQLDTEEKVVFAQRIITLQPERSVIDPAYLKWTMMSPIVQSRIHEKATGATAQGIKSSLLKKIIIPRAPLLTQQAIVKKLDALSEETKRLEAIYERKKAALTELKQSLLKKAFAGEL